MQQKHRIRTVILGAAGRDFHNFNVVYRDDPDSEVMAFTAAQIPGIGNRRYPASLAGPLYPQGIPIVREDRLDTQLRELRAERVIFAYSDVMLKEFNNIPMPNQNLSDAEIKQYLKYLHWVDAQASGSVKPEMAGH